MYNTLLGIVVVSPLQGKLFRLIHYFLVFRCGVQLIRKDCPGANEINNLSPDGNGMIFSFMASAILFACITLLG